MFYNYFYSGNKTKKIRLVKKIFLDHSKFLRRLLNCTNQILIHLVDLVLYYVHFPSLKLPMYFFVYSISVVYLLPSLNQSASFE